MQFRKSWRIQMIKINRPPCPNPNALQNNDFKNPVNKDALKTASHDKCMYCESKVSHIYFGDVEHIKPKSIFPDLEYDWNNLGYACAKCNNKKSNRFDSNTPYIDPYQEEPSNFIIFSGEFVWEKQGSERGKITIIDIGLNRTDLLEKRRVKITSFHRAVSQAFMHENERLRSLAIAALKSDVAPDKEYSLCVRTYLKLQGIN